MSPSSSKILQNIHLVFYGTKSSTKKRKCQAVTEPNSERASSTSSDSSSTVDTSSSEDEKDFILLDYPSDELTSSDSSDSEPEDASTKNLSIGWSEKITRVDTQLLQDHIGPKHPRPHQNPEHHTFLSRVFLQFLETPVLAIKPASQAGQAIQAPFILSQKFEACCCLKAENILRPEASDEKVCTPIFWKVMERDQFIALWGFLHLFDQTDEAVDKIYK